MMSVCRVTIAGLLLGLSTFSRAGDEQLHCRVNAFPDWQPFYVSAEEKHEGPFISYIESTLQEVGIEFSYGPVLPVNRVLRDIKAGTIDILLLGLLTPEREKELKLSVPVTTIETGLIYLTGQSLVPLADARLVLFPTLRKNKSFSAFRDQVKQKIEVQSIGRAFMLLNTGRTDYILANKDAIALAARSQGIDVPDLSTHPVYKVTSTVHLMINPRSPCVGAMDRINNQLTGTPFQLD